MKILVADDERCIADYIAGALNERGYRALPVYSGYDAVEHARMLRFDAALLGFVMPGMLGTEVALQIKTLSPETKIVIMTEKVPPEVAASLRRQGFHFGYLPAPFSWNDLAGLLRPDSFIEDSTCTARRS